MATHKTHKLEQRHLAIAQQEYGDALGLEQVQEAFALGVARGEYEERARHPDPGELGYLQERCILAWNLIHSCGILHRPGGSAGIEELDMALGVMKELAEHWMDDSKSAQIAREYWGQNNP